MSRQYFITSESVSKGHPNKLADQISDAILDAYLTSDRNAHLICEVLLKNNTVVIAGEATSSATVDHEGIARAVLREAAGRSSEAEFDAKTCEVISLLSTHSADTARGEVQNAGNQGVVFGYATTDTPMLLPAPTWLAHNITYGLDDLRQMHQLPWLGSEARSQVTIRYQDDLPVAVDTVVVAIQHATDVTTQEIERALQPWVLDQIPRHWQDADTRVVINPTGHFEIGEYSAACGLTGRRTANAPYWGMAPHGGGASSGKDPSWVERCGAYAARHIACNIVASGLADRCEVQIVYAAGIAEPIALDVDTRSSGRIPDADIADVITQIFDDLRPQMIIRDLDLMRPIYQAATVEGLFGWKELDLPWERRDRIDAVREAALGRDPATEFREDRFTLDGSRIPAYDWGGFSNDDFFRVLESEAYRHYCYDKHPILKDNGGLEFYNPDNLRNEIKLKKEMLLKAWHPKHQRHFRNTLTVCESWLEQVNWIIGQLRQGR